jgi:hypothetical protein
MKNVLNKGWRYVAALWLMGAMAIAGLQSLVPASAPALVAAGSFGVASALAPTEARAALTFSAAARSDMMTALLPSLNSGTIKFYNGTKPASLGTPSGTLLATLTMSNPAGTVSSGVLTVGSVTQTASSHVNGTPTFVRFSNSSGTAVADIDIGSGAGNLQFNGTVVNGQVITLTGVTLTAGN